MATAAYRAGGSPRPRPSRPGPCEANPGRPVGERGDLAGRAGSRGGGQWASSWCVTREFLKGEVSGIRADARGGGRLGTLPALQNNARGGRATMQWRALVLGLVLLRLGLHAVLWLVFGLGPSMGFYQRFPLPFAFQRLRDPDGSEPVGPPEGPAWLHRPKRGPEGRLETPREPGPGMCGPAHWGYARRGCGPDEYERRYSSAFPPQLRAQMRDLARGMFVFGYDNYMAHAFPQDELNPIYCRGRGPDRGDP